MIDFSWGIFLGGIAFFFFGLSGLRKGLQHVAGDRLRDLLLRLTNNRLKGFGFGALITMLVQSSSATTAMLVGFCGAGLLTLPQAFAVVLGSDVGTTAVVFLLAARHITDYALIGIALGIALNLWSPQKKWKYIGEVLFGFCLMFYGISLMVESMAPLKESAMVEFLFGQLAQVPFWAMIGAALFAALVHSSAATLGLALSLAIAGVIDLAGALPLVLGANIGTTITAAMSAVGGNVDARRVAAAHVVTKVTGAAIVLPLLGPAALGLEWLTLQLGSVASVFQNPLSFQIALGHLAFNIGLALIFLPFLPVGVALVMKIFPGKGNGIEPFGPKYLERRTLETPSLAYAQVHREVIRLGHITHELYLHCLELFDQQKDFTQTMQLIDNEDDKVDLLEKRVRFFLAELSQETLTDQQSRTQIRLLRIAGNFEEIGDSISKEMRDLARKHQHKPMPFSDEGWAELRDFHEGVDQVFMKMIACLTTRDEHLAEKIDHDVQLLSAMEIESRATHLQRLHEGLKESIETSSIHLDLLRTLSRIASKLNQIAKIAISGD
jgi:phosphate:Na+ symporter